MPAHTPGSWKVVPRKGDARFAHVIAIDGPREIDVAKNLFVADARLIAAAPRMLDVIERLFKRGENHKDLFDEARAILRDVEGESHG